jgi:hypothetical protein
MYTVIGGSVAFLLRRRQQPISSAPKVDLSRHPEAQAIAKNICHAAVFAGSSISAPWRLRQLLQQHARGPAALGAQLALI